MDELTGACAVSISSWTVLGKPALGHRTQGDLGLQSLRLGCLVQGIIYVIPGVDSSALREQ